jgi:hypothetical protein
MMKRLLFLGLASWLTLAATTVQAQVALAGNSYTQSFNSLPTTGTANAKSTLPAGWDFAETGTAADATYAASNGSSSTGNTYSYGAANDPSRAFGTLQSGSLIPTIGAGFSNTTGATLTGLTIAYTGQTWRIGAVNHTDKLIFQYSTDATSLNTGTWTNVTALDYTNVASATTSISGTSAPIQSSVITSPLNGLTIAPNTMLWIRWNDFNATGSDDGTAIDDFSLTWNGAAAPQLTAPATLAFPSTAINSTSVQTYTLAGANLSAVTTLTTSAPFALSKTGNSGSFSSTLTYSAADLASPVTVYVQFAPTVANYVTGSVSNVNSSASTTVALSATGYDPTQTSFSFNNCTSTLSDGWSQYSVSGPQLWACTTSGRDPNSPTGTAAAPYGVQMRGYASGNIDNEDWFISPAFDLTSYAYPLVSFWSRTTSTGPALKLRVSTNYSGIGAPSAATWTDLNVVFPGTNSDIWTQTTDVNLAAFKGSKVYVAFVYNSTTSAAARWTVDDIALTNSSTPPAVSIISDVKTLSFGYTPINTTGTRTLNVTGKNLTNPVTLTASSPLFTLSKDGSNFSSTLTLTQAEVNSVTKTVTVHFQPTTSSAAFSDKITVSTPGAVDPLIVSVNGDTYDLSKTLEVVNWNIEWFGSPVAGNGPANKALQQTNVSTIINYLNADVYALVEVVDTVRLQSVVTQLSNATGYPYAFQVSRYGSYGDNPQDPEYANDQKMAFVYRTDVLSNVSTGIGLLRCTEQDACPAYDAWAGGRFPYLLSADVTLDGITKRVNFVMIHAKTNVTNTSLNDYNRRQQGATLLKNLLDTSYPNQNTIILGDYNDVLNGTIAAAPANSPPSTVVPTASSYDVFLQDSLNYVPLTLPLARAGAQSIASYATVLDNVITSKPLTYYYINGTAAIRTDAADLITNYASTTTNHYPVFTRYSFAAPDLLVNTVNQIVTGGKYNTITVTSTGAGILQGSVQVNTALTVQAGGSLDTNCLRITGNGSFTVADGGTLSICDAAGIAAVGQTGAVQVTGTRSFSPDANYVYNGTVAQSTGTGLPSKVRALTTTNSNTLTLSQPLAVSRTLTVASRGNFDLNGQVLTLLSSATGTALVVNSGTGSVQGATATAQRYLDGSRNAGLGNRHLAAPVNGSTVADLSTANFTPVVNPTFNTSSTPGAVQPYPSVLGYDESRLTTTTNNFAAFDKGFFSPTSFGDALVVGKGYSVNIAANQVVDFVGTFNNGTYSQALTRQDQTADGGWQLLGNPYPAPLDYSLVAPADRSGLDAAMYVYSSTGQYTGQYRTYVNGIGNPILPMGQAFFVHVSQGQSSANLTLRNSHRVSSYATQVSVQRGTGDMRPRLTMTLGASNGNLDELYVYAETGATTGFDTQQDVAKIPGITGLNVASLTVDGQPLSIQALPVLIGQIALRVQVPAAGTYTFNTTELLNLPAGTNPVLEDNKTGQRTPLVANGNPYTFTVAAGENTAGRFWLNFMGASRLATQASALQTALAVYPNPTHNGQATLLVPASMGAGQVQVLDALGRLVHQQLLGPAGLTTLQLIDLPAGVYIVRVQVGNDQATRRLTLY